MLLFNQELETKVREDFTERPLLKEGLFLDESIDSESRPLAIIFEFISVLVHELYLIKCW